MKRVAIIVINRYTGDKVQNEIDKQFSEGYDLIKTDIVQGFRENEHSYQDAQLVLTFAVRAKKD